MLGILTGIRLKGVLCQKNQTSQKERTVMRIKGSDRFFIRIIRRHSDDVKLQGEIEDEYGETDVWIDP